MFGHRFLERADLTNRRHRSLGGTFDASPYDFAWRSDDEPIGDCRSQDEYCNFLL
jgi:hypothetical protein